MAEAYVIKRNMLNKYVVMLYATDFNLNILKDAHGYYILNEEGIEVRLKYKDMKDYYNKKKAEYINARFNN